MHVEQDGHPEQRPALLARILVVDVGLRFVRLGIVRLGKPSERAAERTAAIDDADFLFLSPVSQSPNGSAASAGPRPVLVFAPVSPDGAPITSLNDGAVGLAAGPSAQMLLDIRFFFLVSCCSRERHYHGCRHGYSALQTAFAPVGLRRRLGDRHAIRQMQVRSKART